MKKTSNLICTLALTIMLSTSILAGDITPAPTAPPDPYNTTLSPSTNDTATTTETGTPGDLSFTEITNLLLSSMWLDLMY